MNILHVIPSVSPAHGGPSHAIAMLERALTAAGVCVTTATTNDDGPGRTLSSPPASVNGAARAYARKWVEFYKVAPGLTLWLWSNARRFDVIHIHALFSFPSVAAAVIARLRGVPYIVRPLGTLTAYGVTRRRPLLKRWSLWLFEERILRHAAAVHFTSGAELDEAKSLGAPFRAAVIPLAVEREPCGDARLLEAEIRGRRAVLYLSRLDPKKNVEALLEAFAALAENDARLVLLIAGGGPADYAASLRALAVRLGLEESVVWLGHVDGARKAAAFAAAEIFVLPSFSENFGIAAAEALLSGLPCVLGEGVAIAADVQKAGAGLAAAPAAAAIADAVRQLLGDGALRRQMGDNARAFAAREYAPCVMAGRLIALYQDVCAPQRKPSS